MQSNELIPVHSFCVSHKIELSFIESLQQYGLVEITTIEEQTYLAAEQLTELEKYVRLHYDLDINLEGIEAIRHLLERLNELQARNIQLQNKLNLFENRRQE